MATANRSNVGSIAREGTPAERLHSKTVYSHCRPIADTPHPARKPPVLSHSGQPKQALYAIGRPRLPKRSPQVAGGGRSH